MTITQFLSGNPLHHSYPGIPATWSDAMQDQAAADLVLATQLFPELVEHIQSPDPDADVEDFWEKLASCAAAIRVCQRHGTSIEYRSPGERWAEQYLRRRFGGVATIEEAQHASDPLLTHEIVTAFGGRWMQLAGYSGEPGELEHNVVDRALERARAGVSRLVVKWAGRKAGLFTLELTPESTADDISEQLFANDEGWTLIRVEGRPDTMLLQDWIPMTYEYRLFVVDGVVVSGAGCIEEFTPYSRRHQPFGAAFDARMRKHRGNAVLEQPSSSVIDAPGLLERYRTLGSVLAARAAASEESASTFVLDLALNDATDEVVVVELNTLPNAGLYAASPDHIAEAVIAANDRGYSTYAWAQPARLTLVPALESELAHV